MPWNYKNGLMKISDLINVTSLSGTHMRVLCINNSLGKENNPDYNLLKDCIISSLEKDLPVTILYSIGSPYFFYKNQDLSG